MLCTSKPLPLLLPSEKVPPLSSTNPPSVIGPSNRSVPPLIDRIPPLVFKELIEPEKIAVPSLTLNVRRVAFPRLTFPVKSIFPDADTPDTVLAPILN